MIPFFTSNQGKALESRVDTLEQAGGGGTEVSASTQLVTGAVTANSLKIGNTDYNLPQPAQVLPNYLNEQYEEVVAGVEMEGDNAKVTFTTQKPISTLHAIVVKNVTLNSTYYLFQKAYYYSSDSEETGLQMFIINKDVNVRVSSSSYFGSDVDFINFDNTSGTSYELDLCGHWATKQVSEGDPLPWGEGDVVEVLCVTSDMPFYNGGISNN